MIEKEPIQEDNNPIKDNNKEPSISQQEIDNNAVDQLNTNIEEPEKITTDMEIYHPHGIHHKRKFKDYIFEFIMLFMAITGGFFMENIRESFADRHKEKEYIGSLVKDIEFDTTNIQRILRGNQRQIKYIDSLINLLESPIQTKNLQKFYIFTFSYLNNFDEFTPHDITIIQLKNSSGLRLIENKSISDSIVLYYSDIDHFRENNEKTYNQFVWDNVKLEMMFMDFIAIEKGKFNLYDTTKIKEIKEFKNRALMFKDAIRWDSHVLNDFYKQGASLVRKIKKEYKIF